ncbi:MULTISPECIES: hypothetical protein [unclassified Bradyrhizobium]|jgi:hypothetical protein|uniref:hypothetical protein n=1 Tax=unclassified Bradyrhizobium TaxID=2631580 RepID=UPI001FE06795|nr:MULTISPECIES: hypothetical protein [unclassified Bradyrhizobium]
MKGASRGISVVRRSKTNDANRIDCDAMDWLIALAFPGFCWWRAAKVRERAAELAVTGIGRSPLFWVSNALVAVLSGLVLYIAHIHDQSPVPAFLWLAALAIIAALLFLRRALKWRYPV